MPRAIPVVSPARAGRDMTVSSEELVAMVDRMPTFSQNVVRILELTSDINTAPKDLVRLVEHDPVLTIKVLKLVNSAYFGLSKKVTSIKQGVVYIGINTIKNLAVSIAAIGALPRDNEAGFDMDDFWYHSLFTATVAKLIAQERGFPKTEVTTFFIAGLLHDIGQIVFTQFIPDTYRKVLHTAAAKGVTIDRVERSAFGMDHAEVGGMLAEKWQLPAELVRCIRFHHAFDEIEDPGALEKCVFIANQVAKQQVEEAHRVSAIEPLPEAVGEWLQMPLDEVAGSLPDLATEIENARTFVQV